MCNIEHNFPGQHANSVIRFDFEHDPDLVHKVDLFLHGPRICCNFFSGVLFHLECDPDPRHII
jgi:hypothetical protein